MTTPAPGPSCEECPDFPPGTSLRHHVDGTHSIVPPLDFGQQMMGYEDPHPWVGPLIWGLAFAAFCLMVILGQAPWP